MQSPVNLEDWIWKVLSEGKTKTLKKVIIGVYLVWSNRNLAVHGKQWWTVGFCTFKASSLSVQFEQRKILGYKEHNIINRGMKLCGRSSVMVLGLGTGVLEAGQLC